MESQHFAFDDAGNGPAVVLIHGHPFDRSLWWPQHEPLVSAGFRLIAPDLRGFGETPATPGTVTMAQFADDVRELLDRLGIESAAVIGLSMGGLVAMEFAHAYPHRAWAVGLVATTAQPVTAPERERRIATAARLEADGMDSLVRTMNEGLFGPRCPADVKTTVDTMMRAASPVGAAAALRGRAQRPDYRPWLGQVTAPVFVCVGTADPWSTEEVTREITASLRSPQVLVLDEVGHLPNLEAPARFNAELVNFLRAARESRS
jgi:3-oxoadipate enol-lactonase